MRRRYELTDEQYDRLQPLISGKPGDPGRNAEDNRRFLNAVLWIARTGAPWEDLPDRFGKYDTVYQRFNRWAKKGRWQAIFEALQEPDLDWVMLDSSTQEGSPARRRPEKGDPSAEALGRSRGGFSTKVHVVCDALGNPLEIALTPGQAGDCPQAQPLLERVVAVESVASTSEEEPSASETPETETPETETPETGQRLALGAVLGDKGYDSDDLLKYVASLKSEERKR